MKDIRDNESGRRQERERKIIIILQSIEARLDNEKDIEDSDKN